MSPLLRMFADHKHGEFITGLMTGCERKLTRLSGLKLLHPLANDSGDADRVNEFFGVARARLEG